MNLEVGMYVRFNYHRATVPIQISKIKEKHYEDIERYYYYLTDNGLVISEAQILKASHNIIDLIEVGDIVITPLGEIIQPYGGNIDELKDYWKITKNPIKSIVTKEQFESLSYKLGDDK